MIQFGDESVRTLFHALSIDMQRVWIVLSYELLEQNKTLVITRIEHWSGPQLEIGIRIDEKTDVILP